MRRLALRLLLWLGADKFTEWIDDDNAHGCLLCSPAVEGPFHSIFKFPNITRPVVALE